MAPSALQRQRGVAMVMALLMTTLAVTIVASLFWRQQVQVRNVENQRLQLEANWALHGAFDLARRALLEDARASSADHLDEAWNSALSAISLDAYLHQDGATPDNLAASLSGTISDAQGRFNLANLAANGAVDPLQVAIFRRLLVHLGLNPALAGATAERVARSAVAASKPDPEPAPPKSAPAAIAPIVRTDDLLAVDGYRAADAAALGPFVIVLPAATPVNLNTASPELVAAVLNRTVDEAKPLIASRKAAYFKDGADIENRLQGQDKTGLLAVESSYFLVDATVRIGHAVRQAQALVYRKKTGNTTLLWARY